ncbi:MAG TPA: site-2 protease family protein [Gemmatimonadales bacterium]|nr:site-2 protease family protein [Gemmatimonadales bacterium]
MNPRPRLRGDLVVLEQTYRGQQSYVVKDPTTHKYFRFRPVELYVIQSFDGQHTPTEIAEQLQADGLRVSPGAVAGFAQRLSSMGLLERSLAERTTLELERLRAQRHQRRALFRGELLRMRFSAGDPDVALTRLMPYLRWCFSRPFVAVSVALFASYFLILGLAWGDLRTAAVALYSPSAITLGTILLIWATLAVIIIFHELGHAFTCKYFGGAVHEMGFMMLYFQPAFYCNVNDAWSFPELRARLWVTAAGTWVQLILAALGAWVWLTTVPGTLISEIALAAVITGGITSVLTNMNPLLPLDGYFALSDWLEIPNLRLRAREYFGWAVRRHVLRLDAPEPAVSDRDRRVFLIYGACAALYIGALFAILGSFLLGWTGRVFGVLGTAVAVGGILLLARGFIRTWFRTVRLAIRTHRAALRGHRWTRRAGLVALAALLVLLVVPWWITVRGPFRGMPADTRALVAPDSAVVVDVPAREGMLVDPGAPVLRLRSLALDRRRVEALRAVDSLGAEEDRARARGQSAEAEHLAASRAAAGASLAALNEAAGAFTLRARERALVLTPRPERLLGRRVELGDTLLLLGDPDSLEVRIALADGGAPLVGPGAAVRLVSFADAAHPLAAMVRATSAAAPARGAAPAVEARVRVASGPAWLPGATGEASVRLRRTNLLGALWWGLRKRVRPDLLL